MFSIIGLQSFSNSMRRRCVWINPVNSSDTYVLEDQFCGSYMLDGVKVPFLDSKMNPYLFPKGYTCPTNSQCRTLDNPYSGTFSFDNILNSLELSFVMISINTFSEIMYRIVDAEFLVTCLFFMIGVMVLGIWLANLFVAVIISSFQETRESMGIVSDSAKASAIVKEKFSGRNIHCRHLCRNAFGRAYHYCRDLPLVLIAVDLTLQSTINVESSKNHDYVVRTFELFTTCLLAIEIVSRFILYLPRVKLFISSPMNCIDTTLAVATVLILLPSVQSQPILYGWLSIFQILRFYRITVAIGFIRDLWAKVLSNFRPILNITIFYYLITFLASILACTLMRGVIPIDEKGEQNFIAFNDLANAFIAMYIISSTENWTGVLYAAVEATAPGISRVIVAAFFMVWYVLSSFVVLNMFIAVITENLEISPEGKKKEQIKQFVADLVGEKETDYFKATREILVEKLRIKKKSTNDYDPDEAIKMIQANKMENFLLGEELKPQTEQELRNLDQRNSRSLFKSIAYYPTLFFNKAIEKQMKKYSVNPFNSQIIDSKDIDNEESSDALVEDLIRRKAKLELKKRDYLITHPFYNRSLFIFKANNPIRVLCQKLVAPSYGMRVEGTYPKPFVWYLFSSIMFLATIGLVGVAICANPIYYKRLVESTNGKLNWVIFTDSVFLGIFSLESIIKIIADGFYFTPNAYLRSAWGVIDFSVLITLWINLFQEVCGTGQASRFIRAFKALRALRLLTFSPKAQQLFYSVIIVGIGKLITASFIAFGLLCPFAIWGLNIFKGRLYYCSDSKFTGSLTACTGEYSNSPFNWDILSPRTVTQHAFDFDGFGHSFAILFEIISLEGWTEVLEAVVSIVDNFKQPQYYANRFNAVFIMFFNLIGTVFIVTLFVSVIIQNYSSSRGSAFMTEEQKTWYEIERSLKMVRPPIRPYVSPNSYRYKVLSLIVNPRSWFNRCSLLNLFAIGIMLVADYYPRPLFVKEIRDIILIFLTFSYLTFILFRLYGLGARKFFQKGWHVYSLFVTTFSFFLLLLSASTPTNKTINGLSKFTIVCMLLLFIPKSRRLDHLINTCAASASSIGTLLSCWFILFLAYGIAFNQVFGMTKMGAYTTSSINFRTVPHSLVLLFRTGMGEGWNSVMSDYLVEYPNCYESPDGFSDCGSTPYAYFLFLTWNVASMYVFGNMLISLIYENFRFVSKKPEGYIDREEVRKFKNTWFKYDPKSTGFIPMSKLHDLLADLNGYFSLKIHEEPWTVRSILANSKAKTGTAYGVDLKALRKEMRLYPREKVKERREMYERFCHHALLLADPEKGISFHTLMIQFPFYKNMNYSRCLKLSDYIRYRDIERRIELKIKKERATNALITVSKMLKMRSQQLAFSQSLCGDQSDIHTLEALEEKNPFEPSREKSSVTTPQASNHFQASSHL